MTRRLTISGSRTEMGLLHDTGEPETPPPVWTPAKNDFWRKPSRWQICMPRLRFFAKILLTLTTLILMFRFLRPPTAPAPVEPPTEAEMKEMAAKEDWVWKDFQQ